MTISELTEKWNEINPFSGGYLLVSGEHPLLFHIGYSENGLKQFLVLNTGKIEMPLSSKAVHVECIQLRDGEYALRFSLCYESLDELFVKLCWDLMDASRHSSNPLDKLISQYNNWRRLFQQAHSTLLSSSMQKGLLGELLYLSAVATERGWEEALRAWVGPEGCDQDFNFSDKWVEVKTVSVSADAVSISSVQQLERQDIGKLVVYFLEKTSSGGASTISLSGTISAIKEQLASQEASDMLVCKLAKYGYFEKDADSYSSIHYRYAENRTYTVTDGFPKLTRDNIPTAVTNAKYSISLAMIDCFKSER